MGTVTADNTRINNMDSGTASSIGGGAGTAQEPDAVYQGTYATSRKVSTSVRGFYIAPGTTEDGSGSDCWMAKVIATNSAALVAKGANGLNVRLGSDTSAYYEYYLHGNDTYPTKGGWIIIPVSASVASHRDATTGSPVETALDYFGVTASFSSTSKAENLVMDAIDFGTGLTVTGSGSDFQDFIDADEGTGANRYGYVSTIEGLILAYGTLKIGTSGTSVQFDDESRTVVFPDGLFKTGFSRILVSLENAATTANLGGTFIGRGSALGHDTRPQLEYVGTSGTSTLSGSWENFSKIDLTASVTANSMVAKDCGTITQNGATLNDVLVTGGHIGETAIVIDDLSEVNGLQVIDCANSGIDLTAISGTEITLTNIVSTGNSSFDLRVDNAADVTIYLGEGSDAGTAFNQGAGNVSIVNSKTLTLTGIETGSRVSIVRVSDLIVVSETLSSSGDYVYSYEYTADVPVFIRILSSGKVWRELDYTLGNANVSIPINQALDRVYNNP